jgi:hypothetical protein
MGSILSEVSKKSSGHPVQSVTFEEDWAHFFDHKKVPQHPWVGSGDWSNFRHS